MAATKRPSGLSIARNALLTFTFNWKISDQDYGGGQQLQWRLDDTGAWTSVSVGAAATSKRISITASNYYPTKNKWIKKISFRVRGKRQTTTSGGKTTTYDWSEWTEYGWLLNVPAKPSMTAELDDTLNNVTKFSWSANVSNTDEKNNAPFVNCEYQSVRVKESNVTDGSKLKWNSSQPGWSTGTGSASGNVTYTEDSVLLANNSYTRWVRVRSRGPGQRDPRKGVSDWRYAKHVYAIPFKAVIKNVTYAAQSSGVTNCVVTWTAASNAAHPIDSTTVQWAIDTPAAGFTCPNTASWTDGPVIRDTAAEDKAKFSIASGTDYDTAMWVRVMTKHDRNETYSVPAFVRAAALTPPTNLSVQTNSVTFRATITATNNSEVPDSRLAVVYRATNTKAFVIGIIPHGSSSVTVQCPDWSGESAISFGVYAFQGDATAKTRADGVPAYTIKANMTSRYLWDNGSVPQAPDNVTAELTETEGEVMLTWDWTWSDADSAELSWSTNPNAWESTDAPETFEISNLHAAQWRVSGLETGQVWYFRVRLGKSGENNTTYGPYSDAVSADLSSAPNVPVLILSDPVIPQTGSVTASWNYLTTDGTQQAYAEVCTVTISGSTLTYGDVIARAKGEQHVTIYAEDQEWTTGQTYNLAVRVTSESNHVSAWSEPVSVVIAEPVTCTIEETSLETVTLTDEDSNTRSVLSLTEMPLTVTVEGAGEGGTTALVIERLSTYILDRPDESQTCGYEGETIVIYSQSGEDEITIGRDVLIGVLDDGAAYRMIATTSDSYGQSAEAYVDFEVHWEHQALEPNSRVEVVGNNIVTLTPIAPTGTATGDTCDIYRLSADKPVKIISGGTFGTVYVDPYPTIGERGGYRFVFVTADGDYITQDNTFAWHDVEAYLDIDATIIDFDGRRVLLEYDMDLSHSWSKDFTETTYLGGSVQGDWNKSVHRSTSLGADTVVTDDPELIENLRRLAVFTGICHVRTVDGSTFTADVQVSENRAYEKAGKVASFSIDIKAVEQQQLDGILYSEWVST